MAKIIDMLDAARAEDLADVDQEIQSMGRRLDSLKSLRRVLSVRLNGKPERNGAAKGGGQRLVGKAFNTKRREVVTYLSRAGRTNVQTVGQQCAIPADQLDKLFDHEWFNRVGEVVALSAEGREEAE